MADSCAEGAKRADQLRIEGNDCFNTGNFAGAIRANSESLDAHKTAAVFSNRAMANSKMERYEEAIEDAKAALELDPGHLKARFRLAEALHYLGRQFECAVELRECYRREPHNTQILALIKKSGCLLENKSNVFPANAALPAGSLVVKATWDGGNVVPAVDFVLDSVRRFGDVRELQEQIMRSGRKRPFHEITLNGVEVTNEIMEFFRSAHRSLWQGCCLDLVGISISEEHFAELFGGKLLRPRFVWMADLRNVKYSISAVLSDNNSTLTAFRNAPHLQMSVFSHDNEEFLRPVAQKMEIQIDALVDYLHSTPKGAPFETPYTSMPAFDVSVMVSQSPSGHRFKRHEWCAMMQRIHGVARVVLVDCNCLRGAGNSPDRALRALLKRCKQRFLSDACSVSYFLQILCSTDVSLGNLPIEPETMRQNQQRGDLIKLHVSQDTNTTSPHPSYSQVVLIRPTPTYS